MGRPKEEGRQFTAKIENMLAEAFKDPVLLRLIEVVSRIDKLTYRIEQKYGIEVNVPHDITDVGFYVIDLLTRKLGDVPEVIEYENLEKEFALRDLEYQKSKGQNVPAH
jgi:hypothetical protein